MIIDGHAHVYNEKNAEKIVSAFTELHRMEPTASLGQGTVADLVGKMKESVTDYTVLANFGPSRSVEKINEWTLSVAEECPNVIFDTSITMTGERCIYRIHDDFWESDENVVDAFRRIGCRRISFGSDYPFGNPSGDIRRIRRLGLSDSEKELIFGGNSCRLYMAQP